MLYRRLILWRALIASLLVVGAGSICDNALGIGPGWPAGPVPTPLSTPPPGPSPSPAPSATPTPVPTPAPTPLPASYVQVITYESPRLQYRDGSGNFLPGVHPENGPYTCVVAMYLNSTDPVQFALVRTFEPRSLLDGSYGPSQPVSSPGVSVQYTKDNQLANVLTTLTVYPHPENPYGRETLSVYTADVHGNALTFLAKVPILVYPISTAKIFNAFVTNPLPSPTPAGPSILNPAPSPYPAAAPYPIPYPTPTSFPSPSNIFNFFGETVRFNIEICNAYPGGTTWVTVSPTASPASVQEVVNSRVTAPATNLIPKRNIFIEARSAKNASGGLLFPNSPDPVTYTIQVIQYRPPYGTNGKEILATATFVLAPFSFNINSQIGKLTP